MGSHQIVDYLSYICLMVGSCDVLFLQIVKRGLMTQAEFDEASSKALSLFEFGQVTWTLA